MSVEGLITRALRGALGTMELRYVQLRMFANGGGRLNFKAYIYISSRHRQE